MLWLCVFSLIFLLLFSERFPKKVNSYFIKLLKWHLLWKRALRPAAIYRRLLHLSILNATLPSSLLQVSNIFPLVLSSQSSVQDWGEEVEEGAIYNVTLKRVQIQQAANKGARWLGVSGPIWCLTLWQNHSWRSFSKEELQSLSETDPTHENLMLFPLS